MKERITKNNYRNEGQIFGVNADVEHPLIFMDSVKKIVHISVHHMCDMTIYEYILTPNFVTTFKKNHAKGGTDGPRTDIVMVLRLNESSANEVWVPVYVDSKVMRCTIVQASWLNKLRNAEWDYNSIQSHVGFQFNSNQTL